MIPPIVDRVPDALKPCHASFDQRDILIAKRPVKILKVAAFPRENLAVILLIITQHMDREMFSGLKSCTSF
jgi:hypothetical protein